MKALADYVHSKGLKLGIYSSPGPRTCAHFDGSYGYEDQDAATYAAWGVDYLKYDLCSFGDLMKQKDGGEEHRKAYDYMREGYEKMHRALLKAGRPIVYSYCQYGLDTVWQWGPAEGANLWRTTGDIQDRWDRMTLIGFAQAGLSKYSGPGHWNDPDMLEIGNGGMSKDEYLTHMSLWALLAAPLLAGNDLSHMDETTRDILTNPEVIAVDQDPLGIQGDRVSAIGPVEVWMKPLRGGGKAIGLFNRRESELPITLALKDVGFETASVRDLWTHKDLGEFKAQYETIVPRHGVTLLLMQKH
jgi:alpha-galactosidase